MDETVLVLVKKIDMRWVGPNLPAGIPAWAIIEVPDTSNNK